PKPTVFIFSADALGCAPGQTMMVAAHSDDLAAATAAGLRTAFVARPDEHGSGRGETSATTPVDYSVTSLLDLADQLGCSERLDHRESHPHTARGKSRERETRAE